jgi:GDP-L-fucose synthase
MGELQAEAYAIELGKKNISIVRPANVYGSYDNFDPNTAMVIPSLIAKCDVNEEIEVWGDGSQIRDFIHARDVAKAMLFVVENEITEPLNVGSNTRTPLRDVVNHITQAYSPVRRVKWDTTKPTGDAVRVLDSNKLVGYGFQYDVPLQKGLQETIDWYVKNKHTMPYRYNPFTEKV